MTFLPSQDPDDLAAAVNYLRERTDAELTQIIASPTALINRLPGFTVSLLRTAEQHVVVDLAKDEANRRNAGKMLLMARLSLGVAVASALASIASAIAAYFAHH